MISSATGARVRIGGEEFLNFASCSLLGLHVYPGVLHAFQAAATDFGLATGGSRLIQGRLEPIEQLESLVATSCDKEAAITFASGLLANMGFTHTFGHSVQASSSLRLDLDKTIFVMDRDSHWSVQKSVEPMRRNRRVYRFRHNDMDHLSEILRKLSGQQIIILFESIYSVDGSVAPIREIIRLAQEHGALTYVDDANGYQIYGSSTRPFYAEFQALNSVDFRMISFSKAVGVEGGAIASSAQNVEALEWLSGTSSFTATILPPAAAAAMAAVGLIQGSPDLVDNYLAKCHDLRSRLAACGFQLNACASYITNVMIGDDAVAEAVRREFLQEKILVPVFRYPASPRGQAGLRLIPSALHTDEDISRFIETLVRLRGVYGF
ncbi:MAG: pyridoxal phosphate-dependent aminotransferase family protein [Actinomycetia bacterium]|nr:pyridoxal phosphate-dependent aminotransferase family protein [Actinomycetes bacterium]